MLALEGREVIKVLKSWKLLKLPEIPFLTLFRFEF